MYSSMHLGGGGQGMRTWGRGVERGWVDRERVYTPLPRDSYCSGRYAFYWNAYLLNVLAMALFKFSNRPP